MLPAAAGQFSAIFNQNQLQDKGRYFYIPLPAITILVLLN